SPGSTLAGRGCGFVPVHDRQCGVLCASRQVVAYLLLLQQLDPSMGIPPLNQNRWERPRRRCTTGADQPDRRAGRRPTAVSSPLTLMVSHGPGTRENQAASGFVVPNTL